MVIIEQMPLHLLDFCSISYKDPELWHYGILTFVINWFPGVIASVHLLSYQRNELGFIKTFFWCGKWSLFVAIAISTIVMYISTYYVQGRRKVWKSERAHSTGWGWCAPSG